MKLFFVGHVKNDELRIFEIAGIYDTHDKALARCTGEDFWMFKLDLNHSFADETIIPGPTEAYWPALQPMPEGFDIIEEES